MRFKEIFLLLAMVPITSHGATVVKFGAVLCDETQHMSSGACVDIERDMCPSGYYKTLIGSATFSAPTLELKSCMNSYDDTVMSDLFYPIYNGVLVSFGVTLCGADQYLSDGTCVSRSQGDCPENFYDLAISDTTMMPRENALCATGYKSFWLTANCASNDTQFSMCATLCDAGLTYTGTGACSAMCSVNPGRGVTLNGVGGLSIPLYSTRMTAPSVNVATTNGGVCYGNLVPGTMRGAINVTVSGKNYYVTD